MFEWGDIRYLLAVARTGSSLAAAREVGSSQSTVTRRIDALEAALGLKLFERRPQGYFLTDQGRELLPLAEAAGLAMVRMAEAGAVARRQLSGRIRFAVPPDGGDPAIMGPVVEFMRLHPGVTVETVPGLAFEDVAAGDADIAFRAGPRPDEPGLILRKVGEIVWQPCCSVGYAEAHGLPSSLTDLGDHKVIGAEGQLAQSVPFRRFHELVEPCALRGVSIHALIGYVRVGAGISILPEVTIAGNDDIIACLPPLAEAPSEAWLITREDIRKTPHVRAFLDHIAAHLTALLRRNR
ncbi:LysR family transcriptional regulator [Sandarakinorhabdus oryzae]|uniref:LysR family transcriptional regulator n=1 Tax=Sandarakinorhabdus oryzae TaxID=2675220 RepID=UPI0012E1AD17|nr:LysR family transcriptional regulator [Sandarakinorhabdus oryzae]